MSPASVALVLPVGVAIGIGMLVGIERERRKGQGDTRKFAGVRTFTVVALLGCLSALSEVPALPAVMAAAIALLATVAYARARTADPGVTTEVALLATFLLGVMSKTHPSLAAGVAVVLTISLAARDWLHTLVREKLTPQEVHDGLLLAASALVILPLLPDHAVDPFGILVPRTIWRFAVLIMSANAAGYLALRIVGPRYGLPLAGLAAGFVSSAATHAAMGARARETPDTYRAALAGAAWSSVATIVGLGLVLAAMNASLLPSLLLPMAAGLAVALATAMLLTLKVPRVADGAMLLPGRAFQLRTALAVTAIICLVLFASSMIAQHLGTELAVVGIAASGFADFQSAAASAAAMVSGASFSVGQATAAIWLALATNSLTKLLLAWRSGGASFAGALAPGLLLMPISCGIVQWLVSHG
jgi:uncharacterized membrane protein (DUF4010 family)